MCEQCTENIRRAIEIGTEAGRLRQERDALAFEIAELRRQMLLLSCAVLLEADVRFGLAQIIIQDLRQEAA